MFNWLSQMVVAVSIMTPIATNTSAEFKNLPPQPTQDQIACHDVSWQKQHLASVNEMPIEEKLSTYVQKMLRDGQKEGHDIVITSGYRTCTEQGQLRAMACGIGNYNLFQKPISQCAPPTEPAGRSLHNEGLAVDLACSGYSVFAYSPCYTWLKPRAHLYQVQEHQLEPWHWSTTGK